MKVRFLVQESCVPVEKYFPNYEAGMKFVQKVRRSKKLRLLSYTIDEE